MAQTFTQSARNPLKCERIERKKRIEIHKQIYGDAFNNTTMTYEWGDMCVHSCVSAHHHRFVYECAVTRIHIANALNKMYFVAKVHTYVNIFKTEGFFFYSGLTICKCRYRSAWLKLKNSEKSFHVANMYVERIDLCTIVFFCLPFWFFCSPNCRVNCKIPLK